MTDRNVEYPSRYRLSKVSGTDDIYDLTATPGTIIAEGTPVNKATLLSDPTAAALGLEQADPTVDDALAKLGSAALIQKTGGKPVYTAVALSSIPVGSIAYLMENDVRTKFYVAQQNYEPGLNTNRTLLVRAGMVSTRLWDTANTNAYASSDIDAYLNGPYKAMFSENIKTAMATTRFRYTAGNGASAVTDLDRSIFLLSATEFGLTSNYANTEGSALSIASTLRGAMTQWTRTPRKNNTTGVCVVYNGTYIEVYGANQTPLAAVPAFTLPGNMTFYKDGNVYYEEQDYTDIVNIATDMLGNTVGGFTRIETGSYAGTGTYGSANKNSLTFSFAPRLVILYAYYGNSAVQSTMDSYRVSYMSADILDSHSGANCTGFTAHTNNPSYGSKSTDGKTFMWYNTNNADMQCNISSYTYYYIAIG